LQSFITPQGWFGRLGDWLMVLIMYLAQGTFKETPQRTHFWNNTKFQSGELPLAYVGTGSLHCPGDVDANPPFWFFIPRFHIPILGGWRTFVVLDVLDSGPWHIGWVAKHGFVGVSRIPLHGPVRMTIGPGDTTFFAIKSDGTPRDLHYLDDGRIGEAGEWRHVPLL